MRLRDLSFPNPEDNINCDEALFRLADKSGDIEYLRFWESPVYFIVLGRIGSEADDVADLAKLQGIPVLRRSSGGGTVVQGPGCLNYTLVLSKVNRPILNDLRASYEWISNKVIEALDSLGVKARFHPISDIALAGSDCKFSGNAQRRGKTHILHHGTILYDFDLDLISKYLKMPKDIPEYRKARIHKDFVSNIQIDPALFKKALSAAFGEGFLPQPFTSQEISSLKDI